MTEVLSGEFSPLGVVELCLIFVMMVGAFGCGCVLMCGGVRRSVCLDPSPTERQSVSSSFLLIGERQSQVAHYRQQQKVQSSRGKDPLIEEVHEGADKGHHLKN
eukprot:GHVS01028223.1.p1 GENE.GHVS01028223.1~~GHVS01028223.1.p1  ORF type:complete len:104 (+),score=11.48 GHVS01028223.1:209-520(+)